MALPNLKQPNTSPVALVKLWLVQAQKGRTRHSSGSLFWSKPGVTGVPHCIETATFGAKAAKGTGGHPEKNRDVSRERGLRGAAHQQLGGARHRDKIRQLRQGSPVRFFPLGLVCRKGVGRFIPEFTDFHLTLTLPEWIGQKESPKGSCLPRILIFIGFQDAS